MTRFNIGLAVVAIVQIVLLLVTGGGADEKPGTADDAGRKPYSSITEAGLGKLEITDDDMKSIVLEQTGTGDDRKWVVASSGGFPVKDGEIKRVVESLNGLRISRLLTRKPKKFTGLEVSESRFARHIVLGAADGTPLGDFYIGDSDRPDTVRFREKEKAIAYEATGMSTWDLSADASSWIDTGFTDLESGDVVRLKLVHGEESFEIALEEKKTTEKKDETPDKDTDTKPGEEKPEPKPEKIWVVVAPKDKQATELDKSKVDTMLSSLCRLYASEPIGRVDKPGAHGFDKPTSRATLTLKDGAVTEITIGSKREEEGDFYAMRSGFDFVVTLRSWSVTGPLQKKLQDLTPDKKEEKGGEK